MASFAVMLFLLVFPFLGCLIAWLAVKMSPDSVTTEPGQASKSPERRIRIVMLLLLPATLLIFALVLYLLYSGSYVDVPANIQESGAIAYGVPALLAGIGMALIYYRGIPTCLKTEKRFARLLTIAIQPMTAAIIGLCTSFLLLSRTSDLGDGLQSFVDASRQAAILISIGAVGPTILGAIIVLSTWDFKSDDGWRKALLRLSPSTWIPVICFILALFIIGII